MEYIIDMTYYHRREELIYLETNVLDYFEVTKVFPIEFLELLESRNIREI